MTRWGPRSGAGLRPEKSSALTRLAILGLLASFGLCDPEAPPVEPVRVCEVLQDMAAYNSKVVAVVGRYSFRQTGRFLSEESCEHKLATGAFTWPNVLRISFDEKTGPKPPEHMEVDTRTVYQKLRLIEQHTALAKIRFGNPDYDRWAVVYGRIEPSKEFTASVPPASDKRDSGSLEPAPGQLICRSDVVVMFIEEHPEDQ